MIPLHTFHLFVYTAAEVGMFKFYLYACIDRIFRGVAVLFNFRISSFRESEAQCLIQFQTLSLFK